MRINTFLLSRVMQIVATMEKGLGGVDPIPLHTILSIEEEKLIFGLTKGPAQSGQEGEMEHS
jgi:hypothetical protein